MKDTGVLFTMLNYLPNVFLPMKSKDDDDEMFMNLKGMKSATFQALLFLIEFLLLITVIPAFLVLPGILFAAFVAVALSLIHLLSWPLEGSDTCFARMDDVTKAEADKHLDECWIFINGCATDHMGLQKNINLLSKLFGREVIGIHNRSFGLLGDLVECLIQRCFSYRTHAVRVTYATLKPLLADPQVSKLVLIGHSQGGIIVSLALDQLFAELPPENMAKLEVYTFGSAASHFSNPLISLNKSRPSSPSPRIHFDGPASPANPQHAIAYIEHYANEYDMIPRWGVLYCAGNIQNSLYAGTVFVRLGASGHFFNQHYLSGMFSIPKRGTKSTDIEFLDQVVSISTTSTNRNAGDFSKHNRENIVSILRKNTGIELGTGDVIHAGGGGQGSVSSPSSPHTPGTPNPFIKKQPVMMFSRTNSGEVVAEQASGKTVRELSRLWKYLGGSSPSEHRVDAVVGPLTALTSTAKE